MSYDDKNKPDFETINQIRRMVGAIVEADMPLPSKNNQDGSLTVYIEKPSYITLNRLKDADLKFHASIDHIEVIVPTNDTGIQQTFKAMEKAIVKRVSSDMDNAAYALPEDRQAEFKKRILTAIAKDIGVDAPNMATASSKGRG